jgi:hypothetical protein
VGGQLFFVNFDKDIIAVNLNFMSGRVLVRWHAQRFTGFHVEAGSVARAFDFTTVNRTVAQRATIMSANIVNTIIRITVSKKNHDSVVSFDNRLLAGL